MTRQIPESALEVQVNRTVVRAVEPITAEASGWIDQANTDLCIRHNRLVLVTVTPRGEFDLVVGYIDREFCQD